MTELETIKHAKDYIDKLANGINPLDDSVIPDDDVINQVRLSRCLFFVSDVLRRVIENEGISKKTSKKGYLPFSLPYERRSDFKYSDSPITVSEISNRINELKPDENMKKFSYSYITEWLVQVGVLQLSTMSDGRSTKRPTQKGNDLGIVVENRNGTKGVYSVVLYDKAAQKFIIDNLDAIFKLSLEDHNSVQ